MSLRVKFGVLLGLLGLAALLTLAASWWAFTNHQNEVQEPFRSMSAVGAALSDAKQALARQSSLIDEEIESTPPTEREPTAPPPTPLPAPRSRGSVLAAFDRAGADAENALLTTDISDWKIRSGAMSLANLRARMSSVRELGRLFLESRHPSDGSSPPAEDVRAASRPVRTALTELHELLERMERRILTETSETLTFDSKLQSKLLGVLGLAMAVVLLSLLEGFVLIRRWVLAPVQELRRATGRIAAGDFAYRIPLPTRPARADELHRLSGEVNHMAGMVKAMQDDRVERERLAALGEMIRRLAHNLRNPLSGIRGLAEITRSDLASLGGEAQELRENQTRIILSVDRFEKWLTELLGATRPLTLRPETTEVPRWLSGLVEAHRPMALTRGVDLEVHLAEGPQEALFDPRHLEYAVSAMLSNAIETTSSPQAKVGGNRGKVIVQAHPPQENGESGQDWAVSITDQGAGIPPDLRESIFQPYFTTKRDGNGIGLAVALQVVKAHGGRIRVESPWPPQEGGFSAMAWPVGAKFTIYLPANRPTMANGSNGLVASEGHSGVMGGQDPRH